MFHQTNIVLIGNSLVEQSKSIAHLKKRVINIDSFNDEDLIGENYKNSNHFGLVNDEVLLILKNLNLNKNETIIIVCSDYERDKDYYSLLKSYGRIIGNSQRTILKTQDYENLSKKLKKNNIKFPRKIFPKIVFDGKSTWFGSQEFYTVGNSQDFNTVMSGSTEIFMNGEYFNYSHTSAIATQAIVAKCNEGIP